MSNSGSGYTADELATWVLKIRALLDECGEPYALMGGAAVMLYGRRARTRDIDFVVLGSHAGLADRALAQGLIVERKSEWHLRLWSADRAHYADIVAADAPLLEDGVRRASVVPIAGVDVPVVPLEVLVALKVIAGRPRDLRDVADILESRPEADREEIGRLLAPFGLALPG